MARARALPETSRAAFASVTRKGLRDSQLRVLRTLGNLRNGGTDVDIARAYHDSGLADLFPQTPSGLRTRRRELADAGLVVDSGKRKRLHTGRNAIVWSKVRNGV
ncbi:hypothetical protein CG716_04995 [Mycolicibacterium sphagni]|uniref:Uncharacterized protein n=1 Tax=Mycolicibacterium sphagni TaxID=1786 RepID=A0A255DR50_9MYCO|nr:hypothetical protein CG716_04995 [Mycolicibacterium sphagni]